MQNAEVEANAERGGTMKNKAGKQRKNSVFELLDEARGIKKSKG